MYISGSSINKMITQKILISVVVPVYNVSKYLHKCIDSIINQTYKSLEIILVDDGSTDGSSAICDYYAQKDPRIKVIHKPNGGLSSARNAGIEVVSGDYVSFIDSDDWLEFDYYQVASKGFPSTADIINCNYSIEYKGTVYSKSDSIKEGLYQGNEIIDRFVIPLLRNGLHMQVWNNLYSIDFIKRQGLSFESERKVYAEDDLFNTIAYLTCDSLYKVYTNSYIHLIVEGSLSQSYRKGLYNMLQYNRRLKREFILSKQNRDLLAILDSTSANQVAYCLFKESLCPYGIAYQNIRDICESADVVFHSKNKATGRYAILYLLGRLRLYNMIIIVSKIMNSFQSFYRYITVKIHR